MTLYALEDIDDALDATRAFLWPFDLGRWARLALIVFFLGGVGGFNPVQFPGGSTGGGRPTPPGGPSLPGTPGTPGGLPSIGGSEVAVIAAVVGVLVLIGLGFLLVASIMEFVLVESLRREAVTVRRYWGERWRQGLRLFGFRLVVGVLSFGVVGLVAAAILFSLVGGDGAFALGLLVPGILVFVLVAVVGGLANGFTTVFVVPIMIREDRALLAAWRRFWPTLTGQWKQYAAYAVLGWVLQLVAGLVAGIATLLAALVLAIPLAIVGLLGAGLLSVVEVAGWVVVGLAVALFLGAVFVVAQFVAVPVQTFLRYYALFVLGDTNDAFDLIPDRRRALRE